MQVTHGETRKEVEKKVNEEEPKRGCDGGESARKQRRIDGGAKGG